MQNFNTYDRGDEVYPSRQMLSNSSSKVSQLSAKKGRMAFSSEFNPNPTDFETMLNRSNSKMSESSGKNSAQRTMELISQKGANLTSTAKKYQSKLGAGKVVAEYLPQL